MKKQQKWFVFALFVLSLFVLFYSIRGYVFYLSDFCADVKSHNAYQEEGSHHVGFEIERTDVLPDIYFSPPNYFEFFLISLFAFVSPVVISFLLFKKFLTLYKRDKINKSEAG